MKAQQLIICGFPGVGKTHLAKKYNLHDSDSSKFDKDFFPSNYIDHIKSLTGIVLCSTHSEVRKALSASNLDYISVIPSWKLKDEYLQRYKDRGNPESFINMMDENWDDFIASFKYSNYYCLESGDYIEDAFPFIIDKYFSEDWV